MFAQPHHQISLQHPRFLHNPPPRQDTGNKGHAHNSPEVTPLTRTLHWAGNELWPFPELLVWKALWSNIQQHPMDHQTHTQGSGVSHTTPVPLLCPCHRYTALLDVKIKCSNICTHLILTAFNYQGPSILPFSWCQVTWISFTQIRLFQKTSTKPALHLFSCNSCNKENYWKLISVRKSQFF